MIRLHGNVANEAWLYLKEQDADVAGVARTDVTANDAGLEWKAPVVCFDSAEDFLNESKRKQLKERAILVVRVNDNQKQQGGLALYLQQLSEICRNNDVLIIANAEPERRIDMSVVYVKDAECGMTRPLMLVRDGDTMSVNVEHSCLYLYVADLELIYRQSAI